MNPTRILIAEDHATIREGLKLLINSQSDMEVVGEAGDGLSAQQLAQELNPDLIVMDVSMPQVNGLQATTELARQQPGVKVLILTRHSDSGYLQQLLAAGAAGYVLKQSPPEELLRAIRSVAAGSNYLDPQVTGQLLQGYSGRSATALVAGLEPLSEREQEVLRLIAWGYSNKEIAVRLKLSVKTIEAHKANSLRKLGLSSRIDIVRFALLQGWLKET